MPITSQEAKALRAIVAGRTIQEVGEEMDLSITRVRQLLNRGARKLGYGSSPAEIRKQGKAILSALSLTVAQEVAVLHPRLERQLGRILGDGDESIVTPQMLARHTADQLLEAGVTPVSIAWLQKWMAAHGEKFDVGLRASAEAVKQFERALLFLEAYGFRTTDLRQQLAGKANYKG